MIEDEDEDEDDEDEEDDNEDEEDEDDDNEDEDEEDEEEHQHSGSWTDSLAPELSLKSGIFSLQASEKVIKSDVRERENILKYNYHY